LTAKSKYIITYLSYYLLEMGLLAWFSSKLSKKKRISANPSAGYDEIKKRIYGGVEKHADGGVMIICSHSPAKPTDDYRKAGKDFCIKQLLSSAADEYRAFCGEDMLIDDFLEILAAEVEQGSLKSAQNKHWRFDPDHEWNRMTEQERIMVLQGGSGDGRN
jgi:hypothetical protein